MPTLSILLSAITPNLHVSFRSHRAACTQGVSVVYARVGRVLPTVARSSFHELNICAVAREPLDAQGHLRATARVTFRSVRNAAMIGSAERPKSCVR